MYVSLNSTQIGMNWRHKTKRKRESECTKKNTRTFTCIMLIYRPRFSSIRFFRIGALSSQWDSLCLAAGVFEHVCVCVCIDRCISQCKRKRRGINQMPCTQIVPRITEPGQQRRRQRQRLLFSRSLQFQVVFGIRSSFFYFFAFSLYTLYFYISSEQLKATT